MLFCIRADVQETVLSSLETVSCPSTPFKYTVLSDPALQMSSMFSLLLWSHARVATSLEELADWTRESPTARLFPIKLRR